jgi:hypothetical protein
VRKGRSLQKICCVLPEVEKKKGWPLSHVVVSTAIQFYENDEYSCPCPGKKDFVSVKQQLEETVHQEHVQKGVVLCYLFFLISVVRLWVLRPLTGLLYQPRMICDGDCGEIGGMKIGKGNRSTLRKPALAPLCRPQIRHD